MNTQVTWCAYWWISRLGDVIPDSIQSEEYSTDGGLAGTHTIGSPWVDPDGNRNVPILDRNGSERNLNLNWWSNRWNANYRFAAVRN